MAPPASERPDLRLVADHHLAGPGGFFRRRHHGNVSNKNTQKFLQRAVVGVPGISSRTFATPDGGYSLSGLPAGSHAVTVTYPGLDPRTQTDP